MKKKISFLFFACLIFLGFTNVNAASLSYSNATYSYSPVVDAGVYYYYGAYVSNSAIGTATSTTTSNRYAARIRVYAYFTSANALRTTNQYQIKARVCSDNGTFGYDVEQAVPTFIHYAYNTTNSMTGAINGNVDDAIMTYSRVSSDTHCIDFTFTFTPKVDALRAVGFWVTFSRLNPVSTCWEGDCSNEHRQDTYLVSTLNANTGSFNVNSLSVTYVQGGTSTAVLEQNQQIMIQQQQQTNQNLNNIDDSINDDSSPDDELQDTLDDISSDIPAYGPVSSIITMPIALYTAYFNQVDGTCHEYDFGSLYGTHLKLPCINLQQRLGNDLWGIIDSFFSIFMIYNICMLIFSCYSAIINLDDDFQSLYTPQHAGLTRTGRGQMRGDYD